jgi:chaperonin GroES
MLSSILARQLPEMGDLARTVQFWQSSATANRSIVGAAGPPRSVFTPPVIYWEDIYTMVTATKKKTKIKLQPLGDRVVVQREESEETTAGGIVLPDSAKNKPARGKVLSVGDGKLLDDGTRSRLQVKVGDRVIFSSYAGETLKVEDEELLLMHEDDILAVID